MKRTPVWLGRVNKVLWAALLLSLPVTSFPYFPEIIGKSTLVRPLALYPLILLFFLVILPGLSARHLPRTLIPFLVFGLIASLSSIISLVRGFYPPLDISMPGRVLSTWMTLVIGVLFYILFSIYPQNEEDLKFSLTWLYTGFAISLLWASLQIIYILRFNPAYFHFLNDLQGFLSIRRLFERRISGMAYEPSWYAEQLTFVLMPWLLGAVISNYSVFRWRYRRVTVEMVLLGWAIVAVLFTYSRGGMATLGILLALSSLLFLRGGWYLRRKNKDQTLRIILFVMVVLVLLCVIVFVVAQRNNYFSRLWTYWTDEESEGTYLYYIAFSQRFVHWETALRIYQDHPWLGIGLGNYTFFFPEYLPDRQYQNPEIFMKLVPEPGRNQIVTVKNFILRILTETGILGFCSFASFLVALTGCVAYLISSKNKNTCFWGRAGFLGMVAFVVVTFSVDSFAIPNMWVVFGFITASTKIFGAEELSGSGQQTGWS